MSSDYMLDDLHWLSIRQRISIELSRWSDGTNFVFRQRTNSAGLEVRSSQFCRFGEKVWVPHCVCTMWKHAFSVVDHGAWNSLTYDLHLSPGI